MLTLPDTGWVTVVPTSLTSAVGLLACPIPVRGVRSAIMPISAIRPAEAMNEFLILYMIFSPSEAAFLAKYDGKSGGYYREREIFSSKRFASQLALLE